MQRAAAGQVSDAPAAASGASQDGGMPLRAGSVVKKYRQVAWTWTRYLAPVVSAAGRGWAEHHEGQCATVEHDHAGVHGAGDVNGDERPPAHRRGDVCL
jgi:hypothetical protein